MAGSSGGGSNFLGIVAVGMLLLWIYSLIADHIYTILGSVALIITAAALILILYGYIAGASRDDNTEPVRRYVRRKYTGLGTFFWTALVVVIAIPTTLMKAEGQIAHVAQYLLVLGAGLALAHGLGALLGRIATGYWKRRGAAERAAFVQGWQKAEARKEREHAAQEDARRVREEQARRQQEEEARQRKSSEQERQQENARSKANDGSGLNDEVGTQKAALEVLEMTMPFTMKELKARHREMAKKVHPDLGGSTRLTRDVNEAYEILQRFAK